MRVVVVMTSDKRAGERLFRRRLGQLSVLPHLVDFGHLPHVQRRMLERVSVMAIPPDPRRSTAIRDERPTRIAAATACMCILVVATCAYVCGCVVVLGGEGGDGPIGSGRDSLGNVRKDDWFEWAQVRDSTEPSRPHKPRATRRRLG